MEITEDPNYRLPVSLKRPKLSRYSEIKSSDISTECILNDEAEIHKLNDDCLMQIFSFLPLNDRLKTERVCKRWRIVSQQSWNTFKKFYWSKETWGVNDYRFSTQRLVMIPNLEKVLYRCGFFLTHIDFSVKFSEENFSREVISALIRYCSNLQYIKLFLISSSKRSEDQATTDDLIYENEISRLFLNSKKLQYVQFSITGITGECLLNLPTDSIKTLAINCSYCISPYYFVKAVNQMQKLHTLSFDCCKTINDEIIKAICFGAKKLKDLSLVYYQQKDVDCILFDIPQAIDLSPISQLINLERLNVSNNHCIDDETLKKIGANCKLLKNINISSCYKVSNKGLDNIVSLPKLEYLDICRLDKITDEVFTDMPNLRMLKCGSNKNLQNQGLCHLIQKSHNIELLDFEQCSNLNNELVEAAIKATKNRINNVILKMYIYGTGIDMKQITSVSPLLQIITDQRDINILKNKAKRKVRDNRRIGRAALSAPGYLQS